MKRFAIKPAVYFADKALKAMHDIKGERVLIITDPFLAQSGMLSKVTDALTHIPFHEVYTEIKPDPDLEIITKAVQAFMAFRPDVIVAYGGGSTIDATKSMLYFIREMNPDMRRDDIVFVAIPTTSGTGSEVTRFSVITVGDEKIPIIEDELLPDIAILDPTFTHSLPPRIVAETGLDVLTHAIEAYVSRNASFCTDGLAEKSAELVFRFLPKAVQDSDCEEARAAMHHASCIAGMSFTNAGLGINHSIAHAIGARFHISHGQSNAILLPYIIEYNARVSVEAAEKYAALAKRLDLAPFSTEDGVRKLVFAIKAMIKALPVAADLASLGIERDAFEASIDEMIQQAMRDSCTPTNPAPPSETDIRQILRTAYKNT